MVSIYDSENYEPCRSVAHLLGQVRTELLVALDRELTADRHVADIGVTAAQFIVMTRLAAVERKKSASDLCKEMSYDAGAMTRMIDRLESKGLIRRARCPQDRRLVYLEMTEQGRAAYPRLREISMAIQNRFLRGFSRADARQLEGLLGRMMENVA
ncbi:MAG TPA: MarR family transcriptional regulator [Steroidobacteraceae bacterium]|nr:MarR family transcriptional regulator [Steroidobacteraceae bacterium]